MLAAVPVEQVHDGIDLARIDVLATDGEHVVDAPEDAMGQARIGPSARARTRLPLVRSPDISRIIGWEVRSRCV